MLPLLKPQVLPLQLKSVYVDFDMPDEQELQLRQIYFLMPLFHAHIPFSLHDLFDLAIKESSDQGKCSAGLLWQESIRGKDNTIFRRKRRKCSDPNGVDGAERSRK